MTRSWSWFVLSDGGSVCGWGGGGRTELRMTTVRRVGIDAALRRRRPELWPSFFKHENAAYHRGGLEAEVKTLQRESFGG